MKSLKKCLLSGVVFVLALAVFGAEKKTQKIQPRYALVIGNQNYQQSGLDNPIQDARLMKKVLEECCFEVFEYYDLDRNGLDQAIEEYSTKVNEAGSDVVSFFYYSGHGVQIDGKNYLVPTDDKDIDSATKAKLKCFAVDNIFDFVHASTQIFVLDACRNNPFSTKKETFTKGLSPIQAPKSVNFLYLFSTQAGQTAADGGSGKNSLFTSVLANEMKEMNLSIDTVFSNVSNKVAEASNNVQKPLYTGSSVNLQLMNEEVASWKLAQLKARTQELKTAEKTANSEQKKQYSTEENLIATQIKILEQRREDSKKDAEVKAKLQKEADERSKQLQKETEKTRKEAEKIRKQNQENRAKERSSIDFIQEIETNKHRLQEIRIIAKDKIIEANDEVDAEMQRKIDEIKSSEHPAVDYDSKGKLIKAAQKAEDEKIQEVINQADVKRVKNQELYEEPIREEQKDLLNQISKDNLTLKTKKYSASSFIDEAEFYIDGQYDGEKKSWILRVKSDLFGYSSLVFEKIEVPYGSLEKKLNEPQEIYSQKVEVYDSLLRDTENTPFEVRFEYSIKPMENKDSCYLFNATEVSVWYNDSEEGERRLNTKKINVSHEIQWKDSVRLESIEEMLNGYYKAKTKEGRKQELTQKKIKTKNDIHNGIKAIEDWGGIQQAVDGLLIGLGGGNNMCTFDFGYSFPLGGVGGNFFAGPALLLGGGNTALGQSNFVFGVAGFGGFCFTYNIDDINAIRPYTYMALRLETLGIFGFNVNVGCDYLYKDKFGIGVNLGFDVNIENKAGFVFGVQSCVPIRTINSLF